MHDALEQMIKLKALTWMQKALQYNVPTPVDVNIHIADEVLVYRERTKRWEGTLFSFMFATRSSLLM